MKIREILSEEKSEYVKEFERMLIDYLTSLKATGMHDKISTDKISNFMKSQGFDATPAQISDILQNTAFSGDENEVSLSRIDTDKDDVDSDDIDRSKVKKMSQKQLKKEM